MKNQHAEAEQFRRRAALGFIVVAISLLFAASVWWLWRKLFRRGPRLQAG